jgi:hypothetical protein
MFLIACAGLAVVVLLDETLEGWEPTAWTEAARAVRAWIRAGAYSRGD